MAERIRIPIDIKGNIAVSIKSDAMSPMLRRGRDIAVFRKDKAYGEGDVVLIKTPEQRFLIRRVVSVSAVSLIVRADREIKGMRVRKSQICGTLDCFFRDGINRHNATDTSVRAYSGFERVVSLIGKATDKATDKI